MAELLELAVASLTTKELKQELAVAFQLTASNLLRMANIIRELESRGEDLSDLRMGLVGYLRMIAHGQLAASAVIRFAGRPALLNAISNLPLTDQEKLSAGERIELAVFQNGKVTSRLVDAYDLAADQVKQVFERGAIRTVAQQVPLLESKANAARLPKKEREGKVTVDRRRKGLVLNRTFFAVADIVDRLADLRGEEDGGLLDAKCTVTLTEEQHTTLKRVAADRNMKVSDLARRALFAYGVV
jgi:hypothetical protein